MFDYDFNLLDIEEKLSNDSSGQFQKEILEELHGYISVIKKELDKGLAPGEFAVIDKLREALNQAVVVVEKVGKDLTAA